MKISAKGRYGLAAMAFLARISQTNSPTTILTISENLGISKIYLEQVFSLLKHARLVNSSKGSQGGYHLARAAQEITAWDVLAAIELPLTEKAGPATGDAQEDLEQALTNCVYDPLDAAIRKPLQGVNLCAILEEADRQKSKENIMYFI